MNKGIIMEVKDQEVVVLTSDGEFRLVKKEQPHWKVGLEIPLLVTLVTPTLQRRRGFVPTIALVATILLICATLLIFVQMEQDQRQIAAYVYMDINPSVEIGLNTGLEVISLHGLNEDGLNLIESLEDWSLHSVEAVSLQLILAARQQGHLVENHDVLLSTTFVDEVSEEKYLPSIEVALLLLEEKVKESVDLRKASVQQVSSQTDDNVTVPNTETEIYIHRVNLRTEAKQQAREIGISPAKYTMFLEAKEQGVEIELEDITQKSVSQLARDIGGVGPLLSSIHSKHQDKEKQNKKPSADKKNDNKEKSNPTSTPDKEETDKVDNETEKNKGKKEDEKEKNQKIKVNETKKDTKQEADKLKEEGKDLVKPSNNNKSKDDTKESINQKNSKQNGKGNDKGKEDASKIEDKLDEIFLPQMNYFLDSTFLSPPGQILPQHKNSPDYKRNKNDKKNDKKKNM